MYLGDGEDLLQEVVPRKSADIVIIDNPFKLSKLKKMFMYSAAASAIKDDGVMVVFEDQRGWDETFPAIDPYYHVLARFHLYKNRAMRKLGEARSNYNIMNWLTPNVNELVGSQTEWHISYLRDKPMTAESRLKEIWVYNSSDALGRSAGCTTPHRGTKGIGLAGFLLSHIASVIGRNDIVVADPYGGSGTFAIASHLLGFSCYSSEIELDVFENAKTKFTYTLDKAKSDKYWFKTAIDQFKKRTVG